jgi:hypothetical protein
MQLMPQATHLKPEVVVGAKGEVVNAKHNAHGIIWIEH